MAADTDRDFEAAARVDVPALVERCGLEALRLAGERVGAERKGDAARSIAVRDPYGGALLARVPQVTVAELRAAFERARAYAPRLARHERARILRRCAQMVDARRAEIAALISAESGLSLHDTLYEVGRVVDVCEFGAAEALRDDAETYACDVTPQGRNRRVHTLRQPLLGVISAITPFNHPMNQVAHKVVPAVASNNRIVLKPSEKTPLSALLFADLLYEAGLPGPMLSVLCGDPRAIGTELISHPAVEVVSFTGGVAVGKSIAERAGYRRLILELGGNDPIIVMDDADLDLAADLAASGSYKNSGQRCTAIKRMLVHERVAAAFTERLLARTLAWRCGDPRVEANRMGTVIDAAAAAAIEARVDAAVAAGARLLAGHQRDGALYAPTLLDQVRPEMDLVRYETFGPVSPILTFASVDEAIALANGTAYGLSSSVCSQRLDVIMRFVDALEVGTVNVNEVPGFRLELTPFGGIKDSGLGYKEGVREAIKGFTRLKTYSLPW
jgi:putative phosphonoacetaldehyde dehydrogenase